MRNILAILFGLTLASGAALAADAPKFSDLDTDGDGQLSQAEAELSGLDLSTADADQNGTVSEEEYQAAIEAMESGG
jgi:hypothetical protein